ncbi:MAG: hypothetical protein R3337_00350 [Gammaproteobacteria bacterium]|nr:hypothetical protein [Gammaproteobacteria bacterium]
MAVAHGEFVSNDEEAAKEYGTSSRTIRHWRKKADEDPELAAEIAKEKSRLLKAAHDWAPAAAKTLHKLIRRLDVLAEKAGPEHIKDIAKAIETLGDLEMVRRWLSDDEPSAGKDPAAAAHAAGAGAAPRRTGRSAATGRGAPDEGGERPPAVH